MEDTETNKEKLKRKYGIVFGFGSDKGPELFLSNEQIEAAGGAMIKALDDAVEDSQYAEEVQGHV